MTKVSIDLETFSEADLKEVGVHVYAAHPSTEILCLYYAFDDEPVQGFVPERDVLLPERLVEHVKAGGIVSAFNAEFERTILNNVAGEKIGFPKISIEQTRCSMVKARAAGLPGGLGDVAAALGTCPKDDSGRIVMLQLSKPRKGAETRYTPANSPAKFDVLYQYCAADVEAERAIDKVVPDLSASELVLYHLDQHINSRGVLVDLESVDNAQYLIDTYKKFLREKCVEITGLAPSQTGKLAEWIRANGYPQLENLQAETVKSAVEDPRCPEIVKTVLRVYSTHGAKAVSKFQTLKDMAGADSRLRGLFKFYGANTGRWSSTGVQLQNLARGSIEDPDTAIESFRARDLDWVRSLYAGVDPMKVIASTVRGMLRAPQGKVLQSLDFSAIEARVCAWLLGEQWKLDAFRAYDEGTGPDLYKVAYARSFRVDPSEVNKQQRQIGKVQELALSYEGGVGAFVTMIGTYGVKLEDLAESAYATLPQDAIEAAEWMWEKFGKASGLPKQQYIVCDALKFLWRQAHPMIRQGWKDLKTAAEQAVQNPGQVYKIPSGKVMFKVHDRWLYMRLPSGRRLSYYKPRWIPPKEKTEIDRYGNEVVREIPGELRYWGIDTYTRQWAETSTYGGKLCENATQATSRDLLCNGLLNLERAGYPTVMTVHDEVVSEIDEEFDSIERAGQLMCELPTWAEGLPVAVDGHRQVRYRK